MSKNNKIIEKLDELLELLPKSELFAPIEEYKKKLKEKENKKLETIAAKGSSHWQAISSAPFFYIGRMMGGYNYEDVDLLARVKITNDTDDFLEDREIYSEDTPVILKCYNPDLINKNEIRFKIAEIEVLTFGTVLNDKQMFEAIFDYIDIGDNNLPSATYNKKYTEEKYFHGTADLDDCILNKDDVLNTSLTKSRFIKDYKSFKSNMNERVKLLSNIANDCKKLTRAAKLIAQNFK